MTPSILGTCGLSPSVRVSICGPFAGARLHTTAQIVDMFGDVVPKDAYLLAGETGTTGHPKHERFFTVTGRNRPGTDTDAIVLQKDWHSLELLLNTPLAMCHAARYLATKLGCDPGSTAPKWYRIGDNDGPVAYELNCRHGKTVIVHDDDDGPMGEECGFIGLRVHGLPKDEGQPDLDAIVLAAAINALK